MTNPERPAEATADPATGSSAATSDTDQSAAQRAAADENRNAISAQRSDELAQADQTVRSGGPNPHAGTYDYPKAASQEEQDRNAEEARAAQARNITGTEDGIAFATSPQGGVTNMALTPAEVQARLDDEAVDHRGRLVGDYLDDRQAAEAQARRERIEGASGDLGEFGKLRSAAAERVRNLAASPATSGADLGRSPDEQARVNTDKLTGADTSKANTPEQRAAETAERDRSAGTTVSP